MTELTTFMELGLRHILDPGGADHMIFLVALAAIYRLRDARGMLLVVTAFTVGHSITLALAVTGLLGVPSSIIEFLIPVTIVVTGVENLLVRDQAPRRWGAWWRPMLAGVFGLVHGAGFANYLKSMFLDDLAMPLLGFNLGIEVGQVLALAVIVMLLSGVDRLLALVRRPRGAAALQVRIVAVSSLVIAVGTVWAIDRRPW